jgi:hypothetical protein
MKHYNLNLPKINEFYHFWDDGKTGPSRHYICKIERIVNLKEAKKILLNYMGEEVLPLSRIWEMEKDEHDWIFADETDVLIEASCPKYDEHRLWFARTKQNGFFSLNIQNSWQGGRLDMDGTIYNNALEYALDSGMDTSLYTNQTY